MNKSIFKQYYTDSSFIDRYLFCQDNSVDVIIPVIHTNELWKANLISIYREVPVKRLLISDGGCIDDSIEIVKGFPRVNVFDHKDYISLGYCLRKMIESIDTKWFIYLHSDVYLPEKWFDTMVKHQAEYDWFGCPQRITAMIEYSHIDKYFGDTRPYAGSQMGRTEAFLKGINRIDDDYVYRQEDYVLASIIEDSGFKHGRIEDTFQYHQLMHKESPWSRKLTGVTVNVEWSSEEKIRSATMQIKGIIKYLKPNSYLRKALHSHLSELMQLSEFNKNDFCIWVQEVNPLWSESIDFGKIKRALFVRKMKEEIKKILKTI